MDYFNAIRRVSRFTSDRLLVLVIVALLLGLARPATFIPILDYVELLLGFIMLGMGLTLRPEDFRQLIERPFDIGIGAGAQWLVMPLAAYGLYQLLNLPDAVGIGLILVGAAPANYFAWREVSSA